jgi:hypothetical protein
MLQTALSGGGRLEHSDIRAWSIVSDFELRISDFDGGTTQQCRCP